MPFTSVSVAVAAVVSMVVIVFAAPAGAAEQAATAQGATAVRSTSVTQSQTPGIGTQRSGLSETDLLVARAWGLTQEEMTRAMALMRGPRGAFSAPNLSPVEALGIHARTAAERKKYAELFARAHHDDVELVLAWQQAFTDAMQRLYPNEPVVSFAAGGDPAAKPEIDPAIAAAANVPLSAIRPAPAARPAAPASKPSPGAGAQGARR